MERIMLKRLNFDLGRPLPLHFLRRYSKAGEVGTTDDLYTHSRLPALSVCKKEKPTIEDYIQKRPSKSCFLWGRVTNPKHIRNFS